MSGEKKPTMMWVDLTTSVRQPELPEQIVNAFDILRPHAGSSVEAEIRRQRPDTLLFDFDYPERPGLKLMERTKRQFPGIAILMMTVQHSESLAVWAFRSRVWDYLVKPVSGPELDRSISALCKLSQNIRARNRGTSRRIQCKGSPLPEENLVTPRNSTPATLMPALAYIEKSFSGKVTCAAVAKICRMDSFRFSRTFKSAFGITFKEYLLRVRIKEACRLLEKPDIAINEVALLSGFNDPGYFSKIFKRYAGVSPSVYATSTDHREILGDERLALLMIPGQSS